MLVLIISSYQTAVVEHSDAANGKATRATSTPQKSSTHSRKTHGCHIMDLSVSHTL